MDRYRLTPPARTTSALPGSDVSERLYQLCPPATFVVVLRAIHVAPASVERNRPVVPKGDDRAPYRTYTQSGCAADTASFDLPITVAPGCPVPAATQVSPSSVV